MSTEGAPTLPHIDKGKARATPPVFDERTSLLGSTSGSLHSEDASESIPPRRETLCSKLLSIFLVSLSFCVLVFIFIALLAYSYASRSSGIPPDELVQRALVLRGPDRIDVLNVTDHGGMWVEVGGRIGINAGELLGVNEEDEDSVLRDMWKSIGRWGVHRLDRISVKLSTVTLSSAGLDKTFLANVTIPPLELPLTVNPPPDDTWLRNLTLTVFVQPSEDIPSLVRYARDSWMEGTVTVQGSVESVVVKGGRLGETGWRKHIEMAQSHLSNKLRIPIPPLPGLPQPGKNMPLPDPATLVTLQSFLITSSNSHLSIDANATVINPTPPNIHYDVPQLPFVVSLPTNITNSSVRPIPISSVTSYPFSLTHPNITLRLNGSVLPLNPSASPYLSSFLTDYISAISPPILVSTPLIPNLSLYTHFPAPYPKPQILRNVTIKDMKIKPTAGGDMLASGTVKATVVLPKGINVGLQVAKVFPDVLVFDGEVPDLVSDVTRRSKERSKSRKPPEHPLPDPLPERAFAHILPEDWLDATSVPVESPNGEGTTVQVSANIVDVPLEVLPGRDKEFRNFVGKVIFGSQGALAGVQGVAAVAVRVQGLPFDNGYDGEMELDGLPFQGSVRIGKKGLLVDHLPLP
ncbi:hypothetical protein C8Q75DRAFT_468833 [Abortiporus biennis]|nr:hypothetical protein C8Q75DRAFT_468833 [Abortiporus biennis]